MTHMPTTAATTPPPATGSAIVTALEATYAAVQERNPDLPDVVFITGSGVMGRGAKWGHYWRDAWATGGDTDAAEAIPAGRMAEVFIAGERLACGAEDTLETILHEAAHALAVVREVQDVSRDGRYHNDRFRALAEELGLEYAGDAPHPTIGYSNTALTEATRGEYAETIAALEAAIVASMDTLARLGLTVQGPDGKGAGGGDAGAKVTGGRTAKPKASRNNLRAECSCGRIIRASRSTLEDAPIVCGECGDPFLPDLEEA